MNKQSRLNKASTSFALLLLVALAACNSTESALNVQSSGAKTGEQVQAGAQPANGTVPAANTAPGASAGVAGTAALKPGKLQIAPIVGAPLNVVTPLTHRLNTDAQAKGVAIAPPNDPTATYVMKGYFSALAENDQTTVLYVWDVLDKSGTRLHRIQGQEKVKGVSPDSWSAVPASAMEAIADRTIQEYVTWLAANKA